MATGRLTLETPAVIAKRLSDLILCFPSAAAGGVQWQTLVSKYNDRYSTSLDITAAPLGYNTALSAATALLFDTLRIVDASNKDNPIVAVEDHVAMTAQPDASASWPSLYHSLCEIVGQNGFVEDEVQSDEVAHAILVSQLKPLLQQHWHNAFDEGSLSYITNEGKLVRVKKMKHLLQAVLQFREQRLSRQAGGRHTEIDEVLKARLELVPSKKHNDLLLRCVITKECPSSGSECESTDCQVPHEAGPPSLASESTGIGSTDLMDEIEFLRAENEKLRNKNCALEQQAQHDALQKQEFFIPVRPESPELVDVWDSPSEPPPYVYCGRGGVSPCASTAVPSSYGFSTGNGTPLSMGSQSGATPTKWVWDGQNGHICSVVPMWYAIGDHGLHEVPSGVVHAAVDKWESMETTKVMPSFFTMGNRES